VHVIVSSSNPSRVESTVSALKKAYPSASSRVSGHAYNLGDEDTIEANIESLFEKCGGNLDHVIYTAGDALAQINLADVNIAKMKQAGMLRFFGPLLVGKYAPKYLNPGPKSSIILTTGVISQKPLPGWSVINSYATGAQGMTRGLALDLKPIRVNLVSPGWVDTELWANSGLTGDAKTQMLEGIAAKLPTGKIATPEMLAEAYLYLLKDPNITGSMISSNGGSLLT
jgi:NAD(P)-dependent dehydrogenase (short-subunit alcohol dehydrogenase family)